MSTLPAVTVYVGGDVEIRCKKHDVEVLPGDACPLCMAGQTGAPVQIAETMSGQAFWDGRAALGARAGTQDLIARELEARAIAAHVRDGQRLLELGCGTGLTALSLAEQFAVDITALDYAPAMIAAAERDAADPGLILVGHVRFAVADVTQPLPFAPESNAFDVAYTQRCLINLPDWPTQAAAIARILGAVRPGGAYLMCENSQDGLDAINALRARIGLPVIVAPWHNRYLRDPEVEALKVPGAVLERVEYLSSTYAFLSRVVNAALAAETGQAPDYDAPVNRLALRLPALPFPFGQQRLWVWRKEDRVLPFPKDFEGTGDFFPGGPLAELLP